MSALILRVSRDKNAIRSFVSNKSTLFVTALKTVFHASKLLPVKSSKMSNVQGYWAPLEGFESFLKTFRNFR